MTHPIQAWRRLASLLLLLALAAWLGGCATALPPVDRTAIETPRRWAASWPPARPRASIRAFG